MSLRTDREPLESRLLAVLRIGAERRAASVDGLTEEWDAIALEPLGAPGYLM